MSRQEGFSPRMLPIRTENENLNYSHRNPTASLQRTANHFFAYHSAIQKVLKRNNRRPFNFTKVQALPDLL